MMRIMKSLWDDRKDFLKERINGINDISRLTYIDLVKMAFESIYNDGIDNNLNYLGTSPLNLNKIHEIDDGDYQGTQVYLIPFETYQPAENEYLMTYVGYGSCCGCDTLLGIQDCLATREKQNEMLVVLCMDIISRAVCPYNYGWRRTKEYDNVYF